MENQYYFSPSVQGSTYVNVVSFTVPTAFELGDLGDLSEFVAGWVNACPEPATQYVGQHRKSDVDSTAEAPEADPTVPDVIFLPGVPRGVDSDTPMPRRGSSFAQAVRDALTGS